MPTGTDTKPIPAYKNTYDTYFDQFEARDNNKSGMLSAKQAEIFLDTVLEEKLGVNLQGESLESLNFFIAEFDKNFYGGDGDGKFNKLELQNVFIALEDLLAVDIFSDIVPVVLTAPIPQSAPKLLDIDVQFHAEIEKFATENGISIDVAISLAISVNFDFTKIQKFAGIAQDTLETLIKTAGGTLVVLAELTKEEIEMLLTVAGDNIESLSELLKLKAEDIKKIIAAAGDNLADVITLSADKLKKLIDVAGDKLEEIIQNSGDNLEELLELSAEQLKKFITIAGDNIGDFLEKAGDDIKTLAEGITKVPAIFVRQLKSIINRIANTDINIDILIKFLLRININI